MSVNQPEPSKTTYADSPSVQLRDQNRTVIAYQNFAYIAFPVHQDAKLAADLSRELREATSGFLSYDPICRNPPHGQFLDPSSLRWLETA